MRFLIVTAMSVLTAVGPTREARIWAWIRCSSVRKDERASSFTILSSWSNPRVHIASRSERERFDCWVACIKITVRSSSRQVWLCWADNSKVVDSSQWWLVRNKCRVWNCCSSDIWEEAFLARARFKRSMTDSSNESELRLIFLCTLQDNEFLFF